MKEIWKDIKGYEGLYQISNLGRVKSLERKVRHNYGGLKTVPEKILTLLDAYYGYSKITLARQGKNKSILVHRLVAEAFINNPENKPEVNHKDGIKDNNRIDNLEWCTRSENAKHAFDTNLITTLKGEEKAMSKLTESDVKEIFRLYNETELTQKEIAELFPVNIRYIDNIIKGKVWKYLGLINKQNPKRRKGEGVNCAKMTSEKILEARMLFKKGNTKASLARKYKLHPSTMGDILNRKTWTHI